MAKKFSELRKKMSPQAQRRSAALAKKLIANKKKQTAVKAANKTFTMDWAELQARVANLETAMGLLSLSQLIERVENLEERHAAEIAGLRGGLIAAKERLAALDKIDQSMFDVIKRHEETHHGKLMVEVDLKPETGARDGSQTAEAGSTADAGVAPKATGDARDDDRQPA